MHAYTTSSQYDWYYKQYGKTREERAEMLYLYYDIIPVVQDMQGWLELSDVGAQQNVRMQGDNAIKYYKIHSQRIDGVYYFVYYYYDRRQDVGTASCNCRDHTSRSEICKHIIATQHYRKNVLQAAI